MRSYLVNDEMTTFACALETEWFQMCHAASLCDLYVAQNLALYDLAPAVAQLDGEVCHTFVTEIEYDRLHAV